LGRYNIRFVKVQEKRNCLTFIFMIYYK